MDPIKSKTSRPIGRNNKAFIQSLIEDYRSQQDHLSKLEFCTSRGINYNTFIGWLNQDLRLGKYTGRKGRFIEVTPNHIHVII